ncbi:MAG: sulfide/dihydroorotate dehydrogenase-like FAD/NAD-binding protein [Anaerolineales bacterium]|nr:sulfide/dihydroorotate dehydrogenase-like FAD/NAD-binding protein [Anaerolineales bacterium]
MYEILAKEDLAPVTKLMVVAAPDVARKARAGQFVIVRISEEGERIPLTIADYDRDEGTITLIFQEVGKTTMHLGTMEVGDRMVNLTGPLGEPTEIENYGTVICAAGGVGIAPMFPIARALREAGNYVISIIGARNKELLFWEDKMRSISDELIVCTDDGSYGRKAFVVHPLKELLETRDGIGHIWVIGPAIMMKFTALATKPFNVPTTVSLNSIMVDGTGMCGSCRCEVGGETKFACVHGPEFDGHEVDWDLLLARQRIYLDEEKQSLELFKQQGAR